MFGLPSMFRRSLPAVGATLALTVALAACSDDDDPGAPQPTDDTISEVVAADDRFTTLGILLDQADLIGTFDNPNATFTVFAPVDAAFEPLDLDVVAGVDGAVSDILTYHVVDGAAVFSGDLEDGQVVTTLGGETLLVRIDDDGVRLNGARVIVPDVEAENGVIHAIDRVLLGSRHLADVVWFLDDTRELYDAVVAVGLADAFVDADGWTVFAPDNAAFEAVADVVAGLEAEEIQAVLQYHVLPDGATNSTELLGLLDANGGEVTVTTAQGEDLVITLEDASTISFNGGQATLNLDEIDRYASNGIIHLIDGVLLPPSFSAGPTFSMGNEGSSAWIVDGEGGNPTLEVETGQRVEFDLAEVNSSVHPFAIVDSGGAVLLDQSGNGTFSQGGEVDLVANEDGVTFTVTAGLAAELASYICTAHGSMTGELAVVD